MSRDLKIALLSITLTVLSLTASVAYSEGARIYDCAQFDVHDKRGATHQYKVCGWGGIDGPLAFTFDGEAWERTVSVASH